MGFDSDARRRRLGDVWRHQRRNSLRLHEQLSERGRGGVRRPIRDGQGGISHLFRGIFSLLDMRLFRAVFRLT